MRGALGRVEPPAGPSTTETGPQAPSSARPWPARAPDANAFEYWLSTEKKEMCRVIAINYVSLQKGDARMNVVIKDNDVIFEM
jgi:hypothetical protein